MGCVSSAPEAPPPRSPKTPHGAHVAAAGAARHSAASSAGSAPHAASPRAPPPPLVPPPESREGSHRGEKVSAQTLERLRSTFLTTASRGSVYDNYTVGDTLGTGGYAVVKLAVQKVTGQQVAVKIMRLPASGTLRGAHAMHQAKPPVSHASGVLDNNPSLQEAAEIDEEDVFKEIEILKSLDHPAVLKMLEYYIGGARDKVYIVTELLRGGELLEALLERGSYSEQDARTIFRTILEGIAYLHAKRITHRDLKLENLLLADKSDLSSVRIADFGLAKAVFETEDDSQHMNAVCGTPAYVAPEIITGRIYTPAVDLWSAGVILYILLSGVVPFEDANEKRLFAKIARAAYSMAGPEFATVSTEAKKLIAGLMCLDPARRLTAAQALQHGWFTRASRRLSPTRRASASEVAAAAKEAAEEAAAAAPLPAAPGGLAAYAARIKPPVRVFPAGSYIIRRGERATAVYLIRSGTCALILEAEEELPNFSASAAAAERGRAGGAAAAAPDGAGGEKVLATRGAGDFVGEVGVVMDAKGQLILRAPPHAGGEEPMTPQAPPTPASPGGGDKLMAVLSSRKFAKKWVGTRRSVSVRAATDVEAVVLRKREMSWVLDNDASMQEEVRLAVERRQGDLADRLARDALQPHGSSS